MIMDEKKPAEAPAATLSDSQLAALEPVLRLLADGGADWRQLALASGITAERLAELLANLGVFDSVDAAMDQQRPVPTPPLQLLDVAAMAAAIPEPPQLQVRWQTGSTNTEIMQQLLASVALSPAPLPSAAPLACAVEYQTAGRGRLGRHWLSPVARNVALSVGCLLPKEALRHSGLSLAAGVEACRALKDLGCTNRKGQLLGLKWPNDLLLGDAKVGGILTESSLVQGSDLVAVVIGIGVNLYLPQSVQERIRSQTQGNAQETADLHDPEGQAPDRNLLIGALAGRLGRLLQHWPGLGFQPWREGFEHWHRWRGRRVRALAAGRNQVEGVVQGVDEEGALVLRTAAGVEERLKVGEVSLRQSHNQRN